MTSNVRDFGAAGNGSNDDTDAFFRAIEAIPVTGGVLYIPAGRYVLTRNFKVQNRPVWVRGDGIGITCLVWPTAARSVGIGIVQGRQQGKQTDFTHVSGLSLYTQAASQGTALVIDLSGQAQNAQKVVVNRTSPRLCLEQLEIRGDDGAVQGWRRGIHLDHGHHAVLNNIHITGSTRGGAEAGIHLSGMGSPTEVQIYACWVFHVNKALFIEGNVEGVKVSQCDFVAVTYGVYAEHCLQMNVLNCHINASSGCIYAHDVNQSSFSNLLLYKCLDAAEGFGIRIEGNSGRNIVTNNIFVNIAQKMPMHAIQLAGNCHHCITANNVFQNAGTGVVCLPGSANCQSTGNVFEHPGLSEKFCNQGDPSNCCADITHGAAAAAAAAAAGVGVPEV